MQIRIADLFCGIGGIAEASHLLAQHDRTDEMLISGIGRVQPKVVAAIDIDRSVASLYQHHHGIVPRCSTIESLPGIADDSTAELDMWWMSPPCQPYTVRGSQRGFHDARSQALARLIELIPLERPRFLGLENVPAFEGSLHHQQLQRVLRDTGYQYQQYILCPTELGTPMRRKRFYLLAKRDGKRFADISRKIEKRPFTEFITEAGWEDKTLHVPAESVSHYEGAMNIVDIRNRDAIAACFTSAYGKSPIRSGSYLHCSARDQIRRFSPNEIAMLMGFRNDFFSTCNLSQRSQYRLIGNSLSVPVVYELLSVLLAN
ncbi:MAG: DNA cytosine methyltransferase [Rubripirellula sp.]